MRLAFEARYVDVMHCDCHSMARNPTDYLLIAQSPPDLIITPGGILVVETDDEEPDTRDNDSEDSSSLSAGWSSS